MPAVALCSAVVVLLCSLQLAHATIPPTELTFPQLRDTWNASKQWKLQLATGNQASPVYTPVNCSSPLFDACTSTNPPLQQDSGDQLRVTYTLATPRGADGGLTTYKGLNPTLMQVRICYSVNTSIYRAWRTKNKPYPAYSQNCPRTAANIPFVGTAAAPDLAGNTGVAIWDLNTEDEIPDATWFVMLWVWCGNQVCAFESTEGRADLSPPVPGNFIQTAVEMGITPGMKAAAIILSIVGPVFFVAFYIADHYYYLKHGHPLRPF